MSEEERVEKLIPAERFLLVSMPGTASRSDRTQNRPVQVGAVNISFSSFSVDRAGTRR
jgi:hypothetical protein